jgi:glycerol uptake facilitator protein
LKTTKLITGEVIGTFMMCFFGIGAVTVTSLFGAMTGPFQIGMIWGVTIAIAIYVTRHLSGAHFNPAVSVAMVVSGRLKIRELPAYLVGQFAGAFAAGLALWGLFADSVMKWLADSGVTMMAKSAASSIWCEVFPNTSAALVSNVVGACAEGLGVFILVLVIFSLTETENTGRPSSMLAPLFIGLTITIIIGTVGPLTNAGLNPARDLGPRLVGFMVGFGNLAFSWDAILVYTVGPLVGGVVAALLYTKIISPLHQKCVNDGSEACDPETKMCKSLASDACDKVLNKEIADFEKCR